MRAERDHARQRIRVNATVVPLNNFKPSYPWPVTPTLNTGTRRPAGTASYFPGWNVGNAAFAFPLASGHGGNGTGSWGPNSKIENLNIWAWPNDINGYAWDEVNHTAAIYMVQPSYASVFSNLYTLYLFYGVAIGAPVDRERQLFCCPAHRGRKPLGWRHYLRRQPGQHPAGQPEHLLQLQRVLEGGTTTGAALGADTCYYFTTLYNDQTGGIGDVMSLDHFKNLYCENEPGAHDDEMPIWEWDTYNSEIEDQHMGGGGEVYIGGAQQHWIGGNFNNAITTPAINWGSQNTADYVANLGSEPKGNAYSVNSLINFGWGSNFSGTTSQAFSSPTGPFGYLQSGNSRAPIRSQTAETFQYRQPDRALYQLWKPASLPRRSSTRTFSLKSQAMSQGWTYDATSPITNAYVGCNLGNDTAFIYCSTYLFNQKGIFIGPRPAPGAGQVHALHLGQGCGHGVE